MMNWKGKKVLVTGADGFLGSHLTEALVRAGAQVRAFVFYNSLGSWGWLDEAAPDVAGRFEVFPGDIRDASLVRAAVTGCDYVFHLAALIAIPFSYRAPESYVDTNIKGTLNVLLACREAGVTRLVQASTSEVYGSAQRVPMDESHPLAPQSPYAATKVGADQLALSFHAAFGLPVVVLRPFNTFGPRQSARAVIPTIITQALAGAPSIRLGALGPTRDFSYVDDTVEGFLAAAGAGGADGQVVNTGSGLEVSIGDLAQFILGVCNSRAVITPEAERLRPANSEVRRLVADNAKAARLLGWTPKYAGPEGLRLGLQKTVEWFAKPENLARYRPGVYAL
jgi:dTDP-glucose 4,6-dehydratase